MHPFRSLGKNRQGRPAYNAQPPPVAETSCLKHVGLLPWRFLQPSPGPQSHAAGACDEWFQVSQDYPHWLHQVGLRWVRC